MAKYLFIYLFVLSQIYIFIYFWTRLVITVLICDGFNASTLLLRVSLLIISLRYSVHSECNSDNQSESGTQYDMIVRFILVNKYFIREIINQQYYQFIILFHMWLRIMIPNWNLRPQKIRIIRMMSGCGEWGGKKSWFEFTLIVDS